MKLVPHFDPEIVKKFKDETMHPRRHPGRVLTPAYKVPEKIYESIKKVLEGMLFGKTFFILCLL